MIVHMCAHCILNAHNEGSVTWCSDGICTCHPSYVGYSVQSETWQSLHQPVPLVCGLIHGSIAVSRLLQSCAGSVALQCCLCRLSIGLRSVYYLLPVPSSTLQENLKSEHVAKLACVPKGELHSLFPMGLPRGFAKQVRCT